MLEVTNTTPIYRNTGTWIHAHIHRCIAFLAAEGGENNAIPAAQSHFKPMVLYFS